MEMKPGYKRSEVGAIPEDWDASPLPGIIWFQEGPGLRKWQFRSTGLKVINVTNLEENGYLDISTTDRHISWDEYERTYKHFLIDDGDVVMASSGNSYCKTAVARERDLPLLMNTSVIRFKAKCDIARLFMLIYLKSQYFKKQIDLTITGGAQPNFGPAHLRKVVIPLPPTKGEQEAIAGTLTNADALIESLEQLLAKKRDIKQGAMQELLRPKVGWREEKLESIADVIDPHPSHRAPPEVPNGIPFVGIGDLSEEGEIIGTKIRTVAPSVFDEHRARYNVGEELLALGRVASIGKVVKLRAAGARYAISPTLGVIRGTKVRRAYLLYALKSQAIVDQFARIMSGSTRSSVGMIVLRKLKIDLPVTDAEQSAIAAILSDIDAEIVALEEKLDKARNVKLGMMQELLTGRIRLV